MSSYPASPVPCEPQDRTLMDPKNFVLTLCSHYQKAFTRVVFCIEAKPGQQYFNSASFIMRVTTPTYYSPIVTVEKYHYQKLLICSFVTTEPGTHIISVCLGDETEHIVGSPNSVDIHRDSVTQPSRAVMTRVLTAGRIDQDATGLVISGTSKILGITNDPDTQRIYAADLGSREVLVFCTSGGQISLKAKFDAPVPADGRPFQPTGIHFCRVSKLLYVTDKDNHRICIFETNGQLVMSFGSEGYQDGQLKYPWGVAVCPNGEIVAVADSQNHRVQLFNKSGLFLRKYTLFEVNPYDRRDSSDGRDHPRGVCFNKSGNIVIISDFKLKTLTAVNVDLLDDDRGTQFPRHFHRPQGIALDMAGNLFVCDLVVYGQRGGGIRVIDPDGTLVATLEGTTDSLFHMPLDVTVCHGGYVCVVDYFGTRLQIF